jgi:hypothetical protein
MRVASSSGYNSPPPRTTPAASSNKDGRTATRSASIRPSKDNSSIVKTKQHVYKATHRNPKMLAAPERRKLQRRLDLARGKEDVDGFKLNTEENGEYAATYLTKVVTSGSRVGTLPPAAGFHTNNYMDPRMEELNADFDPLDIDLSTERLPTPPEIIYDREFVDTLPPELCYPLQRIIHTVNRNPTYTTETKTTIINSLIEIFIHKMQEDEMDTQVVKVEVATKRVLREARNAARVEVEYKEESSEEGRQ